MGMVLRRGAFLAAITLAVAACGGGDGGGCAAIADDTVALVQDVIDEVDAMSLDELASLGDGDLLGDFEAQAQELEQRAQDADCADEELATLLQDRAGELSATTEFGQIFVDLVSSGSFFQQQ
jgi:hypothetical protein